MKKIIIIVVIFAVVGVWAWFNLIAPAEIYVNDESMGFAPNRISAKKSVNNVIEQRLKSNPNADVNVNVKIKTVSVKFRNLCDDTQLQILLSGAITAKIPCNIIVVDGKPLLGLPTKDNTGEFLIAVKDKYKFPNCEEPEIKENITVDNSAIDADRYFETVDEAVKFALSERKITVITRKPIKGIVSVPPKTVTVSTKKLKPGKRKVISQGKPGKKKAEGFEIYENGKKVREENTFEEYIIQPVPKTIAVGI